MSWEQTLLGLLDASQPITKAIADGQITVDNAWGHPTLTAARDNLMRILGKQGTIDSLLEASQRLRDKHRRLLAKDVLTPDEITALGVLSATAHALSADALARAATPQAIFAYTIQRLAPWITRVASLVDVIKSGGRDLDPVDPGAVDLSDRQILISLLRAAADRLEDQATIG